MFTLRQLVEQRLEGRDNMVMGFIDLEKAYDTVSRDMATLRWMGVRGSMVLCRISRHFSKHAYYRANIMVKSC